MKRIILTISTLVATAFILISTAAFAQSTTLNLNKELNAALQSQTSQHLTQNKNDIIMGYGGTDIANSSSHSASVNVG